MANRIDHDDRRLRLADAVQRIAADRGLHDVGLREIATEAGVSLGALQHYFSSKVELLAYTSERAGQEAAARVRSRLGEIGSPSPETVVREIVAELLPLTSRSRSALLVHVAYLARAVHDGQLRAVTAEGLQPLRDLLAEMLRRAVLAPGRSPVSEAMTLICLAEGVSNYVLLDTITPDEGRAMVDAHLDALFGASPARRQRS